MVTGHHLLSDKNLYRAGYNTYANRIFNLKNIMKDENGNLISDYKKKVEMNVPENLKRPVILALENKSIEYLGKIRRELDSSKNQLEYYI